MKILISAYSCETGRGSEGEIGWRVVHALAQRHEVRVITRANLRSVHAASFARSPKPEGLSFDYFDLPWIFRFYKKGGRFFLFYYYMWQIGAGIRARQILREHPVDVLHHLIGGMDWMPAGLALCRGPFVWGPVGSEDAPPIIIRHLPLKSRLKNRVRVTLRWALRTMDPLNRLTGMRANIILSHTPETLPARLASKLKPFIQTGLADDLSLALPKTDLSRRARLRLVYAGELRDWKGARMALDAALLAFQNGVLGDLTVIGDGPLGIEMRAAARAHANGSQVRFLGQLPMNQLVKQLYDSDLMLYPSFHHGLATIVLQAMRTGLPIVCIEGDATGRAVKLDAGITVPLSQDEPPVKALARAIRDLSEDEERRQKLAHVAQQIATERYSYEALSYQLEEVYFDSIKYWKGREPRKKHGI